MSKTPSRVQKDLIDQMESFYQEMTASSVKFAKDTIDYSVALANQWRKLGLDAAKKTLERFETPTAA